MESFNQHQQEGWQVVREGGKPTGWFAQQERKGKQPQPAVNQIKVFSAHRWLLSVHTLQQ
jgi:hypothetical protein